MYVDHVSLIAGTLTYAGGPYVAGFSGNKPAALSDKAKLRIANAREGEFHTELERFCNLSSRGILFTSVTSSETIDEALIG